ncbi:MAG: MBL fold metallo-hydrolase RNA specificity domain-containing protein, partial [Candidatus Norongarragalinales archaeon]
KELLRARGVKIDAAASTPKLFDGLSLSLLASGHVLGGAMFYAEWDGHSFLYTGDFKTRDSLTLRGEAGAAKPRECETLVVESTYGLPETRFPLREQTYSEIASWVKKKNSGGAAVVLAGYTLGKAQELVACLNEYAGVAPVVTPDIAAICEIYRRHGVRLDYVNAATPHGCVELRRQRFVAVFSPRVARRFTPPAGQRVAIAFASGWCASGFAGASLGFDAGFALSDHADFFEIVDFVEACAPKRVYCVHGFAEQLAAALRKRGFDASAAEARGVKPAVDKKQETLFACEVV